MDNGNREASVQDAFRLFEEGKYRESLKICRVAGKQAADAQTAILTARNLYYLGRFDEAEAYVRDLLCGMPESSYLHSFLGKILERKDEDAAVAEYVLAVTLDPGNQEALRSYAACLMVQGDFRKAIPVQKKLVVLSGKEEDYRLLMQSLISVGQAREALSVYRSSVRRKDADRDHISALMGAGIYTDAAKEALAAHRNTGSVEFARTYLQAIALNNPESAEQEYREFFSALNDPGIGYDYAGLLLSRGKAAEALGVCRQLLDGGRSGSHPRIRLMLCRLNAMSGEREKALGCFEYLIKEALTNLDDPLFLSDLLAAFREYLLTYYPVRDSVARFLQAVSGTPHVVCLLSTARLYEDIGDLSEAQSYYYRAYRSDYLSGGMAYARFLAGQSERRECEKVLLYILNNVKKTRDLETVAAFILDEEWRLFAQRRLLDRLVRVLESHIPTLGSSGFEYLSVAYLLSASVALKERDYRNCKEYCLRGLDIVPSLSSHIHPEDFVEMIRTCKDQTLSDIPVMEQRKVDSLKDEREEALQKFIDSCDEQERIIIEFLRTHREANEMDLRQLLNTRRVVGIMNRIMQRCASSGFAIIEKKGSGQGGEIYAYSG
jgi:tetratricopeptide (TPR) repeat protein